MLRRISGLLALLLLYACTPARGQAAPDATPVRALAEQYVKALNAHDTKAFSQLLTDDAEWLTFNSGHLKGRQQIIENMTRSHQTQYKESVWSVEGVEVAFLKPDVALVYVDWSIRGERDSGGRTIPPHSSVFGWVVVKQPDGWKIRSAQNTGKK
jgi:uncharacterized protein (TIGR02246 family)